MADTELHGISHSDIRWILYQVERGIALQDWELLDEQVDILVDAIKSHFIEEEIQLVLLLGCGDRHIADHREMERRLEAFQYVCGQRPGFACVEMDFEFILFEFLKHTDVMDVMDMKQKREP